jgi:hypothetical protein
MRANTDRSEAFAASGKSLATDRQAPELESDDEPATSYRRDAKSIALDLLAADLARMNNALTTRDYLAKCDVLHQELAHYLWIALTTPKRVSSSL